MIAVGARGEPGMAVSRYPCRACGRATEGEDTYVICCRCLAEFESHSNEQPVGLDGADGDAADGSSSTTLTPEEVEASLRRLLDDW
jgi:hypothetical protein